MGWFLYILYDWVVSFGLPLRSWVIVPKSFSIHRILMPEIHETPDDWPVYFCLH